MKIINLTRIDVYCFPEDLSAVDARKNQASEVDEEFVFLKETDH